MDLKSRALIECFSLKTLILLGFLKIEYRFLHFIPHNIPPKVLEWFGM